MTEKERETFNIIVSLEVDFYQRTYLNGILQHNDKTRAPLSERCALPAVCRLWKAKA